MQLLPREEHSAFPISSSERRSWKERTSVLEGNKPSLRGSGRPAVISLRTLAQGPSGPASTRLRRICSHSKVCSHSSSFNTGCQESLLSKTPLCQNVSSKYIYRSQFPPRLPSVPASSVPRLTYGSKIRTLCACLYKVQEGPGRSGSGDLTCAKGLGSALFGICSWENMWSSHRVGAD